MSGETTIDAPETIAAATMSEALGVIALVGPTWRILRHPVRFDLYRTRQGDAIHYLFTAMVLAVAVMHWTAPGNQEGNPAGNFSGLYGLLDRLLGAVVPGAHMDPGDFLPLTLLIGNIVAGFVAYATCRLLRRRAAPATPDAAAQTVAATAYVAGAISVVFALAVILDAHAGKHWDSQQTSPLQQTAGAIMIFLFWCWGLWIRRIHGVAIRSRMLAALFPFPVLFVALALFALLASVL